MGNLNERNSINYTLLHWAVLKNNYELTKCLLENGADPDIKNKFNQSALQQAILSFSKTPSNSRTLKIIENLVSFNSNLSVIDTCENTPLHIAACKGLTEVV